MGEREAFQWPQHSWKVSSCQLCSASDTQQSHGFETVMNSV